MELNERNVIIDIAKGIGIILIIIGHCVYFGGFAHNWIFAFHVPLFFYISGLFFKETKIILLIKKKTKQLIIPYVIFCIIGFLVTIMIPLWRKNLSVTGLIKDLYLGCPDCINVSSIWFLICLFVTMFMLEIFLKIKKKSPVIACITIIFVVLFGFLYGHFQEEFAFLPSSRLPLNIDCACIAILFLWIGFSFKDRIFSTIKLVEQKSLFWQVFLLIIAITFSIMMVFLNERVNLHGMTYNNWFYYLVGTFIGFSVVILISIMVARNGISKKLMIWFGTNSLKIMGIQAIVVRLYLLIVNMITGNQYRLYFLPAKYALLGCFLTTIVSGIIVLLINDIIKSVKEHVTK